MAREKSFEARGRNCEERTFHLKARGGAAEKEGYLKIPPGFIRLINEGYAMLFVEWSQGVNTLRLICFLSRACRRRYFS